MSKAADKIIAGINDAIAGNFSAVTIDGVRWVRAERMAKALASLQSPAKGEMREAIATPREMPPEVYAAVQQAIMKHPHFNQSTATAFGFATVAIKTVILALNAVSAHDGWKLVPLKPTPEMIEVGRDNNPTQWIQETDSGFAADVAHDVYVSMVSAAPPVTAQERKEDET